MDVAREVEIKFRRFALVVCGSAGSDSVSSHSNRNRVDASVVADNLRHDR